MPRHNRRQSDPVALPVGDDPRARGTLSERIEQWRGEDYLVRSLAGNQSRGPYRCPGCDQEIRAQSPHIVVWPAYDAEADDRRHWHTVCWTARDRRAPTVQRGRGSPRY